MLERDYEGRRGSMGFLVQAIGTWLSCLAVGAVMSGCAPAPARAPHDAQVHAARAKALARGGLGGYFKLCPTDEGIVDRLRERLSLMGLLLRVRLLPPAPVHPQKVFDNLYFLGTDFVSAWAIKTSQGLILLDTLNNAADGRQIETALTKLGLDPRDIRYMVIGHGHADHYGGAAYLKAKYGARVVMSAVDWNELQTRSGFDVDRWVWGRSGPPQRDIAVQEGSVLRLGDTVLRIYLTPGHTPGSIAVIFPIKDGGATYNAVFWGGTNFESAGSATDLHKVAVRIAQMRDIARQNRVAVHISNHSQYDNSLGKVMQMQTKGYSGKNPFLLGADKVQRSFDVMAECAMALAAQHEVVEHPAKN